MEALGASLTSGAGLHNNPLAQLPFELEFETLQQIEIQKRDGRRVPCDIHKLYHALTLAAEGLQDVSVERVLKAAVKSLYDGITTSEVARLLIFATTPLIEKDPAYSFMAARLLLQIIYKDVMGTHLADESLKLFYQSAFIKNIKRGVELKSLTPALLEFDLERLAKGLVLEHDHLFEYLGLQTLYERYLLKLEGERSETPQAFWMRVAMGLAIDEPVNKTEYALSFYKQLSSLKYVSGTPTLFHSGTTRPQLSSCYLTTVNDDLAQIFKCLGDNAQLSKWSGGLGNDWTPLRATNAIIKSIKVTSQGVIPFLKIANDVTGAINRSGSRRGATCAYLETWHLDIEAFLDLRRNTGDERLRTHDMNTANWIPDLFMKRVIQDKEWTLFSPDDVPDLHDLYGKKFEQRYEEYERKTGAGDIKNFKTLSAKQMWRKMLTRLFETGHPWITFKDACNIRSPQDHAGVIHSSNLCTEITLNTSAEETAVCNLGSINLAKHVIDGKVDYDLLATTIKEAIRMLDNVIDINFYPTKEARTSNMRHRPIGMGLMGIQDALFMLDIAFDSAAAVEFSDTIMEFISYHAIFASSELAREKGSYESYKGSKWDRNIFPVDTIDLLEKERGMLIDQSRSSKLDWAPVREHVQKYGMRNSNTMAIAPTATISNIAGCFPCIEPVYKNIYVKANMSGEFTVVNNYLVADLKKNGLWSDGMLDQIKYFDGSIQGIDEIPQHLKDKYKEAFEIEPEALIRQNSARAKWIDQSQSHNVFLRGVSGQRLSEIYMAGWQAGMKTFYYLRTMAASQIEKSTLDAKKFGFTQKRTYAGQAEELLKVEAVETVQEAEALVTPACRIDNEDCESCQ